MMKWAGEFLKRHWEVLGVSALFFALYQSTLAPDVLPADAGEFQVVVPLLGVAHPPGFAPYTVLGKLFISLFQIGSPAYRLNLFSAVTGAATLAVVMATVRRATGGGRAASVCVAIALGVATTFWSQSTTANVRSLAALFTALASLAYISFERNPSVRNLAAAAFSLSLAVVHHLSTAFIAIVFLAAILLRLYGQRRSPNRPTVKSTTALLVALASLAPLLFLIYFPIRGAQGAFLAQAGLDTPAGFIRHVLASGFGGDFFYFANLAALPDRLTILWGIFQFQFNAAMIVLWLALLALAFWHGRSLAATLTIAIALHCFIAITYRAPQTVEYLLPAYVLLAIGAGIGLHTAVRLIDRLPSLDRLPLTTRRIASWLPAAALAVNSVAVLARNLPAYAALSRDTATRQYALSALQAAPPQAVILAAWHYATPMWYLQQVENVRPDVTVEYVFPQGHSLAQNWADRIANANRPTLITNFYPAEYAALPVRFVPEARLWQISAQPLETPPADLDPQSDVHEQGWAVVASRLSSQSVSPSQTVEAVVAWRAPAAPTDINFFVQLIGSDSLLYGQKDVSIAAARIAPGEVLVRRYSIAVNVDAPPGSYALVAGAYLPDGTRLAPDFTPLGTIQIVPRATPPATRHPQAVGLLAGYDMDFSIPDSPRLYLHWRLDGAEHFLTLADFRGAVFGFAVLPPEQGYITTTHDLFAELAYPLIIERALVPKPSPADRYVSFGPLVLTGAEIRREGDGSYRVDLQWLADQPITDDLIVKVDLIGDGYAWRAQSDSVPSGGAIPTLKWIPGIVIHDRHRLAPLGDLPARFELAVYDHFTQLGLPILEPRLAQLGATVPLGIAPP